MQRYEKYSGIITASQQKRRYSTIYYPAIPRTQGDVWVVAKRSDRLDNLAYQHFNDPRLYWIIQKANHLPYGSFMIPPGARIRIPSLTRQQIDGLISQAQL